MEFPAELRCEIERLLSQERTADMSAAAEAISRRYRENDGSGRRMASSRRDILAYAAVRMPATFGAVCRSLQLSLECIPQERRVFPTVLDIGAGTGAASIAAALTAECSQICCIEREPQMLALGERFTEICGIPARWSSGDITEGIAQSAELVLCSYCLNELTPSDRRNAVNRLWDSTQSLLVIIEPGTPEGWSHLMEIRRQLSEMGAHIAAPCPTEGACPLGGGDWCHFTERIQRSKLHKRLKGGEVPYEDEKFCFLAASREPAEPCGARVLRHPLTESGRITLELCTPAGRQRRMVTKSSPQFRAARKAESGSSFPLGDGVI